MNTMMMMTTSTTSTEDEEGVHFSITTSTCTSNRGWKLYDNPFYQNASQSHFHKHLVRKYSANANYIHRLHRDLKFNCPSGKMSSELDQARARIAQLKEELEFERKLRKKAESLNKMIARELVDQRREREKVCDDLSKEITLLKSELEKTKKEIESERKMLKMAEVLREERPKMKLSDAKLFYQEKFLQMTKKPPSNQKPCTASSSSCSTSSSCSSTSSKLRVTGESKRSNLHVSASSNLQRNASPEAENPHIKRGIKGFVEFPRVVKAMTGSNTTHSSRDMGTKLECQKAQLKILMRQKSSVSSNNLAIS